MKRWLLTALALLPSPALAQAYQCRVPQNVTLPPPARPDGPSYRAAITGYTLAVSWSPEFCRGKAERDPDNYQCNGQIGRFGFVLHGLWPESGSGKSPQWCALTPRPTPDDLRANLCMTPVPWLIEHEWAKHGSCMAATPAVLTPDATGSTSCRHIGIVWSTHSARLQAWTAPSAVDRSVTSSSQSAS